MKSILMVIILMWIVTILLMVAQIASANPFLVCDPQANVTHYSISGLGLLSSTNVPAQADGSLKLDLNGLNPGNYSTEIRACIPEVCSAPAFFTFNYAGSPPNQPSNIRVVYQ